MQQNHKILLAVFIISLIFFIPFFVKQLALAPKLKSNPDQTIEKDSIPEKPVLPGRTNILLLGDDARTNESRARTDTIILLSLDQQANRLAVLSIPRDTRVDIPGRGYDKINAAYAYGGAELAVETVADLLDVEIDYYLHTNFAGFKDIIDTLGGVTINVDQAMYYPPEGINLQKGEQLLDGEKALQFVRFRNYPLGDITRIAKQQELLKALTVEILQLNTVTKLPKLLPQLESAVDTNFSISDTLLLFKLAKQFESANIISETLPGNFQNINGIEYWQVNTAEAKKITKELFEGIISSRVVVMPAS